MTDVQCQRRHRLVRFEVVVCRQHGGHRVYRCPMWVGRGRCDGEVVVPRMGPGCQP